MAIDTKTLTELITAFRNIQAKDSISPESLGAILQRIADLLATAGTSETVARIQSLLDGFKAAGYAVTGIAQGKADRNHVYATIGKVNLGDGTIPTATDTLFIQQATTDRAGAMRAQQVTDLNKATRDIGDMKTSLDTFERELLGLQESLNRHIMSGGDASSSGSAQTRISAMVEKGFLRLRGGEQLLKAGYVPYLFRKTKKRNAYHHRSDVPFAIPNRKFCNCRKGWNLFGSAFSVKVNNGIVSFTSVRHCNLAENTNNFVQSPLALLTISRNEHTGLQQVAWGRKMVSMFDKNAKPRMLRFEFAIALGKFVYPGNTRITPAMMATNLAEFSVVYDPTADFWTFGK